MVCYEVCLFLFSHAMVVGAGEPGWHVGWGFESHGGFPLLPASWRSYDMNRSTVGYFLGNASGLDSRMELLKYTRLGIVGLGWQLDNIPSHYSNVEVYELEEAKRLKALRPDIKVMLARETEVTSAFYNMSKEKMYDPQTQDFWTQCGGKPCVSTWTSPAGSVDKYFFNFSNPRLADWWVNEFVVGSARSDSIDGIHFDCSCGAPPGDGLDQQQMQADAQLAFDRAILQLKAMGKWASAWNSFEANNGVPKGDCARNMRTWITRGASSPHTLTLRQGGIGPLTNETIAAFLIIRGASAVLEVPTFFKTTHTEIAADYKWTPLMDFDFGEPLEIAKEGPVGVFTRNWSNSVIRFDCNSYKATFLPARVNAAAFV